jgi:CMP-N-acetylneuraminic acid synthetase
MHVMADLESTDIDTEHDFKMAEVLAEVART